MFVVTLALVLPACGDDAPPATADDTTGGATGTTTTDETSTGDGPIVDPDFSLVYDDDAQAVQWRADDEVLLSMGADAFQIGVTEAIDDALSYDPVHPLAVEWESPSSIERADGGTVSVRLEYPSGAAATVRFDELAAGRIEAHWMPEDTGVVFAAYRLAPGIDRSEGLYGLGEHFDHPNNRGRLRAMQIESDLSFDASHNEVHVPVPFVTGTRGWGLFIADDHAGLFDCATEVDDRIEATFGVGPDFADGLRFYLFGAAHPLDVTRHYYEVTGYPKRPSRWAIGPWIWRNENEDQAQVISDVNTLRDLDLPASGLWVDRPYATGVNTFDFVETKFSDPQAMIDEAHALGLRFALWHTPYVSDDAEPALELHQEAVDNGYYPPTIGLILTGWGSVIDLTNPAAWDWWQGLLSRYADMGVEGYKLDYAEEIVPGLAATRLAWEFADGSTERTMQANFQRLYHGVYDEMLPADGGFLLVRAGTWGDQVYSSVVWPGDLDADMGEHLAPNESGKKLTGGLPAAVAAGSSLGPSGYPLFASDTGGYKDGPPDKETFTRWFQHTALTPVMQIGTANSNVAWEFDEENGFDDEMLGWYRDFTRLHIRLFPYLWTHVERVAVDGRPIVRPVGLAYPELDEHPAFDYLLGDDLLVAPVVERGARERTLVVPEGSWIDWFSGQEITGPGRVTVDAPLDKLPLFVREGAIVPMLRPTVDSLAPTTEPERVDSYDTEPGVLYVRVRPGEPSSLSLYDGTVIRQGRDDATWALKVDAGAEFDDGWIIEAIGVGMEPTTVTLDDVEVAKGTPSESSGAAWSWDPAVAGTLTVRIPAAGSAVLAVR